tara:strand:- start:1692 stop:1901 length:210 start_codon:yes stop_codon:yes gene_type:complete
MNKYLLLSALTLLTGCTQFTVLGSVTGVLASNSIHTRIWSTVDLGTSVVTKKDIKTHAYELIKRETKNE